MEDINNSKSEQQKLDEEVRKLYRGRPLKGHMQDFFSCIKDRALPISDVFTHHRSVSVCHLANIAMLCGRKLTWDPQKEDFVGDKQASSMVSREQRKGFEINA